MEWTFGTVLWWMLALFFWFAVIWMFVGVFADILRRDMSGWAKAGWILLIVVLPFLGILIYLIARPPVPVEDTRRWWAPSRSQGQGAAGEIATAARLRDEGKISDGEYEHLKQQALGY